MRALARSALVSLALLLWLGPAFAGIWVDKDRDMYVVIKDGRLSIYSLGSFYYFDQLFTAVHKDGSKLRLCIGPDDGQGTGLECLGSLKAKSGFNNEGKNRSLHFDIRRFAADFEKFEEALASGRDMKLSIDDGDLFSGLQLNRRYRLKPEAMDVLKLPD